MKQLKIKKIIYNEHHHLDMLKQTFKKHEDIEDYAKKTFKRIGEI